MNDSRGEYLLAYDVNADGSVANRRNFARVRPDQRVSRGSDVGPGLRYPVTSCADGLAVDKEGRVYNAGCNGIQVYSPQGRHLGTIPSSRQVQNLAFAGPDKKTLYLVGRNAAWKIQTLTQGYLGQAELNQRNGSIAGPAMQLGEDAARHRLPRRRVGSTGPRRSNALRVPHARGRTGWPELGDDSQKARGLSRGVRQLRSGSVARFTGRQVERLLRNPGIVRNRLKINSTVRNAKAFVAVQDEFGSFDAYLWRFVDGKARVNRWRSLDVVPARTTESDALSRDLLRRGFKFVGSTICYAYMQAVGLVNDHTVDCFRYRQVGKPRLKFSERSVGAGART